MNADHPICRVADSREAARVSFRRTAPPPEIRTFVESLWTFEAGTRGQVLTDYILPDIGCEIICPIGGSAFIRGAQRHLEEISLPSPSLYMGARLRPGMGSRLFKVAGRDMLGSRLPLADMGCRFPSDTPSLKPFTCVLVDLFNRRNLSGNGMGQRAANLISGRDGRISVDAVATALDCSPRHLHRAMIADIGIGPKTVARIARMRRAVALLGARDTALAEIAVDAGYADQAHMTREFSSLGVPSPARLRQWRESDSVNTAMPVAF